jgi:hypothetical protein
MIEIREIMLLFLGKAFMNGQGLLDTLEFLLKKALSACVLLEGMKITLKHKS